MNGSKRAGLFPTKRFHQVATPKLANKRRRLGGSNFNQAWTNVLISPSVTFLTAFSSQDSELLYLQERALPEEDQTQRDTCDESRVLNSLTENDFNAYYFISQLPPYEEARKLRSNQIPRGLPVRTFAQQTKKTLVLDLDETLCHSTTDCLSSNHDIKLQFYSQEGPYEVFCYKRPYVEEFLAKMSKLFELVLFTASHKEYADRILDHLDKNKVIQHKIYRDSCIFVEGAYLKDLHILGRDLSQTIIIDDIPYSFGYQLDNGIPIPKWQGLAEDEELKKLIPFLEMLSRPECKDVRGHLRREFKLHEKVHQVLNSPAKCITNGSDELD